MPELLQHGHRDPLIDDVVFREQNPKRAKDPCDSDLT
jgi:hypothetical protein